MGTSSISRFWDLFIVFASREISVRYKQSVLGVWWIALKPLATVTIFTVVFSQVLGLENSSPYPYWFFVIAGIVPWLYFSYTISECSASILSDAEILKKIPMPKLLSPITAVVPSAVEFLVGCAVMLFLKLYLGGFDYRTFLSPTSFVVCASCSIWIWGFTLVFKRFLPGLQVCCSIHSSGWYLYNTDWLLNRIYTYHFVIYIFA